jgi:hypothetical protein
MKKDRVNAEGVRYLWRWWVVKNGDNGGSGVRWWGRRKSGGTYGEGGNPVEDVGRIWGRLSDFVDPQWLLSPETSNLLNFK